MSAERELLAALDIKGHLRNGDVIDAYVEDVADALRLGGWLAPSEIAQHDAEILAEVERLREDYRAACEARKAFHDELDEAQRQVADLRARIERVEALTEGLLTAEGWNDPEVETVLLIQRRYRAVLAGSREQSGECGHTEHAVRGGGRYGRHFGTADPAGEWVRCPAPVAPDSADVRSLADRIETAMTDDGHRMPRDAETRYLAHVAAQTALAAVRPSGQKEDA